MQTRWRLKVHWRFFTIEGFTQSLPPENLPSRFSDAPIAATTAAVADEEGIKDKVKTGSPAHLTLNCEKPALPRRGLT